MIWPVVKLLLWIVLICAALYFHYWLIKEGENVKQQRHDAIEDDYI
jgi:hypothetical protein